MSDEDGGRFDLSRRQALAGIGTIGAAAGLGGLGTYAQFTDTEETAVTFTAGGIDGRVRAGASYNGQDLQTFGNGVGVLDDGIGLDVTLDDIKPGDHGCFSFGIEVTNNPAWVAACLGYKNSIDGEVFEPETDADGDVGGSQIGSTGVGSPGEIPENMLVIPFYGGAMPPSEPFDPCVFFDPELEEFHTEAYQGSGAVGTATQFWDNSESGLTPATLEDAVDFQALDTIAWDGSGSIVDTYNVADSIAVGSGCTFLSGALNTQNQKAASPVEPGSEFRFGWDWHVPFDVGNEMQGDELTLQLGFVFGQTRHTESAELSNVFAPQENLPGD